MVSREANESRGVALKAALQHKDSDELRELLSFWDGHGDPPDTHDRLVAELHKRMSNEKSVRKRVKFLSKKLVDLIKFFLRGDGYRASVEHVTHSKAFSYLNGFELTAAINALQKRGFLFASVTRNGSPSDDEAYLVPGELGDILQAFIWDDDRTVEEIFTLRGHLARLVDRDGLPGVVAEVEGDAPSHLTHQEAAERLAAPESVARRIATIDDERVAELLRVVVHQYGGIASRSVLEKKHRGLVSWKRQDLQKVLEERYLGTVRHVSLGEYGIHQFDEAVVVFEEVLRSAHAATSPAHSLDQVHGLGVDLISNISSFLSYVDHNPIKLTLSGKVYRTAVRRLEDSFILAEDSPFDGQKLFQYLFDFCQSQSMIERGPDRTVVLTIKGKMWDRTPLEKKLSRLMNFTSGNWVSTVEPFHGERLLKLYVDCLRELKVNEWYDVNLAAFIARNRYLANLDHFGVRDVFQSRYQFAQQSGMRDPHQLAMELVTWTRERLYLFGLVDTADQEGRPALLRLTALGAKALGIEVSEEDLDRSAPLIVNPDFEIILFPDDDSYDLITKLDRFAERTSSDSAYRFKITEGSIERAVAEGLETSALLRVLSENSRVDVPQNVIYSICQWAEKVKFVSHAMVSLVRGRNKEVIDRILHDKALKPLVIERLSPTALLMSPEINRDHLAKLLEPIGVFLEGREDDNAA